MLAKLMQSSELRELVPAYTRDVPLEDWSGKEPGEGSVCVQMQDLTAGFGARPCVMDIKIGSRTFLEDEVSNQQHEGRCSRRRRDCRRTEAQVATRGGAPPKGPPTRSTGGAWAPRSGSRLRRHAMEGRAAEGPPTSGGRRARGWWRRALEKRAAVGPPTRSTGDACRDRGRGRGGTPWRGAPPKGLVGGMMPTSGALRGAKPDNQAVTSHR